MATTSFKKDIIKEKYFLDKHTFFSYLTKKQFIKDLGAGYNHGEWSHCIQWFLICNNEALKSWLYFEPETIYSMLGFLSFNNISDKNKRTLWDITLDVKLNDESISQNFDFSCPERITYYLVQLQNLPVLTKCITRIFNKRYLETSDVEDSISLESDSDVNSEAQHIRP